MSGDDVCMYCGNNRYVSGELAALRVQLVAVERERESDERRYRDEIDAVRKRAEVAEAERDDDRQEIANRWAEKERDEAVAELALRRSRFDSYVEEHEAEYREITNVLKRAEAAEAKLAAAEADNASLRLAYDGARLAKEAMMREAVCLGETLAVVKAERDRLSVLLDEWIDAATSHPAFGRVASEVTPGRLREGIAHAVDCMDRVQIAEASASAMRAALMGACADLHEVAKAFRSDATRERALARSAALSSDAGKDWVPRAEARKMADDAVAEVLRHHATAAKVDDLAAKALKIAEDVRDNMVPRAEVERERQLRRDLQRETDAEVARLEKVRDAAGDFVEVWDQDEDEVESQAICDAVVAMRAALAEVKESKR